MSFFLLNLYIYYKNKRAMRKSDKSTNLKKANLIAENLYLKNKGIIKEEQVMNNSDNEISPAIQFFPFTNEFTKLRNGVIKTKNDLKMVAGAMFGGASEDYYRKLNIALDEFYQNVYKPIEDTYKDEVI